MLWKQHPRWASLLWEKCPSEQHRCLKHKGEICGVNVEYSSLRRHMSCGSAFPVQNLESGFVLCGAAGSVCHYLVTQGQRCRGSRAERPEGWHCHQLALLMCPGRDQQILRQRKSMDTAEMFGFCLFASRFSQVFSGHRSGFNLVTVKVQGSTWIWHQVFPASLHKPHLI